MWRLILAKTLFYLLLASVLLGLGFTTTSAQSDAPYLYYYHPDLNAWVIERADGTDSRLLGQGVSEKSDTTAEGIWSPTGEWLIWNGRFATGDGVVSDFRWYITRTSDSYTINLTDDSISSVVWASSLNHLFYAAYNRNDRPDGYYIYDADHERVIWSLDIDMDVVQRSIVGQLIGDYFVYWDMTQPTAETIRNSIHIVSLITGEDVRLPSTSDEQSAYDKYIDTGVITQPTLTISTDDLNTKYRLDVLAGTLDQQVSPFANGNIYLNTSATFGLLLETQPCARTENKNSSLINCNTLWLIAEDGSRTQIAVGVTGGYRLKLWIDDSNIAVYVLENGDVYKLDADSKTSQHISGIKAHLPIVWLTLDDDLLIYAAAPDYTFDRVRISEGRYIDQLIIPADDKRGGIFSFENIELSPSRRYIDLGDAQSIYDLATDTFTAFIQHTGAAYAGKHSTYYNWSQREDWLITGQVIFNAGGGGGPFANMVMRPDGTERRELNTYRNQVEWLPEAVIPHLPPAQPNPIIPQPYLTIEHPEKVTGAAWNGNGTQLAVATDNAQIYIWSFGQAEPQIEQIITMDSACGFFINACQITWSPDERFISLGEFERGDVYNTRYFGLIDLQNGGMIGSSDYPLEWDENGFFISKLSYPYPRDETSTMTAEYKERGEATGVIIVQDKATRQYVAEFPIEGETTDIHWIDDREKLFVQTASPCSLQQWDVKKGLIGTFSVFNICSGDFYQTSANGRWAATQWAYSPTQVNDFSQNKQQSLNWFARSVTFTPDNCWLTAGGSQFITIWKLSDLIPNDAITDDTCMPMAAGTYKAKFS